MMQGRRRIVDVDVVDGMVPICYMQEVGIRAGLRPRRSTLSEEASNGLDTPEAARNLHRHGDQRLLRREALDHEFVFAA